jgi:hypothetical protein
VADAPKTGTLDVVLTGSTPLEKTDSGRLELTGDNTFTGANIFDNITRSTTSQATTTSLFSGTASSTNLFSTTLNTGNLTSSGQGTFANLPLSFLFSYNT